MILTVALISGGWILVVLSGTDQHFALEDPIILDSVAAGIDDAWFSDSGDIVSISSSQRQIKIRKWSSGDLAAGVREAVEKQLDVRAVSEEASVLYSLGLSRPKKEMNAFVLFAVDKSGELAALVFADRIEVVRISPEKLIASLDLAKEPLHGISVAALSFTKAGQVAVVFDDGRVRIWRYERNNNLDDGINLERGYISWCRHDIFCAASFASGDIGYFATDRGQIKYVGRLVQFYDGSAIAVSGKGEIAIGTKEGRVVAFLPDGRVVPATDAPLDSPRAVHALSFTDDAQVLAGGDFGGLYMFSIGDRQITRLSSLPGYIDHLSYFRGRIVYTAGDSLSVATLRRRVSLNGVGEVTLGLVSLVLSLLALGFSIIQDSGAAKKNL